MLRLFLALLALFLAGCYPGIFQTSLPLQTPVVATQVDTPLFPTTSPTLPPESTQSGPQVLTIWLPPQFDPGNGSNAGALLQKQITDFMQKNPDIRVQVRIKAASGPGGLLETLSAAAAAAPDALPSLVVLSRNDLETAALKGLVYPLETLSQALIESDWYEYARQLSSIQGTDFGLPFAGDALLILYRPEKAGQSPVTDWQSIMGRGQPLVFPAADPNAMVTLNLYLAAGGQITDAQQRPMLQGDVLSHVFSLYAEGARQGCFPYWLAQYQTDGQAWEAYKEQRSSWVITWVSHYLSDLPADTSGVPLPAIAEQPLTLASGWVWAISDPSPGRQAMAARLAEYLVESRFLAEWSMAAGYLPTRPSSLSLWPNQTLQSLLNQVVVGAQLRPSNDLMASLGPVLQDATLQVIKDQNDPVQVAQAAAERLNIPETK